MSNLVKKMLKNVHHFGAVVSFTSSPLMSTGRLGGGRGLESQDLDVRVGL